LNPVLIGGLISLVSALGGISLEHLFSLLKQKRETRRYPTEVLFGKQTEFYDKAAKILPGVNGYISTIDVWLGETSPDAKQKVSEYAKKSEIISEFNDLLQSYFMYLPEKVLLSGYNLVSECVSLADSPTMKRSDRCFDLYLSFHGLIRKCVGADKISDDLLRAFGVKEKEDISK